MKMIDMELNLDKRKRIEIKTTIETVRKNKNINIGRKGIRIEIIEKKISINRNLDLEIERKKRKIVRDQKIKEIDQKVIIVENTKKIHITEILE